MGRALRSRVHTLSGQHQRPDRSVMVIALPVRARVHVSCQTGAQSTPHHARIATRCGTHWDVLASKGALTMFSTAFKRLLVAALHVSVRQRARDGWSPASDGRVGERAGADKRIIGGQGYNQLQERICRQNSS